MPESSPVEPGAAPHAWRRFGGGSETRPFSYANDSGSGKLGQFTAPPRHTGRLVPRGRRSKKPRAFAPDSTRHRTLLSGACACELEKHGALRLGRPMSLRDRLRSTMGGWEKTEPGASYAVAGPRQRHRHNASPGRSTTRPTRCLWGRSTGQGPQSAPRIHLKWRSHLPHPPRPTVCARPRQHHRAAARHQAAARTRTIGIGRDHTLVPLNRRPHRLRAQARAHAGARGGRGLNYRLGADSSVGSAPHSHCGGRGFESHSVHHDVLNCELRRSRRPQRCPERQSQQKPGVRFPTGPTQHPTGVTRHARK